jgi:hypothetical protein
VGQLLNAKFVAAHQQAGDSQVTVRDGRIVQKNGGNVASYFCTPEGRVIHAVLGPVDADQLLREARWAIDAYELVRGESPRVREARLAAEHRDATRRARGGRSAQAHRLLAEKPLPGLETVYEDVLALLGEGQRAKGLASPEVLAIAEENDRLREEERRLAKRVNGTGSAKAAALKDENARLRDETQRLRTIDEQRRRKESEALHWLRTAAAYLASGTPEDTMSAEGRLRVILERYSETKAAEKAAEMLKRIERSPTTARPQPPAPSPQPQ